MHRAGRAIATVVLVLGLALVSLAGLAAAQPLTEGWEARIATIAEAVQDEATSTDALSVLREDIVRLRGSAIRQEIDAGATLSEVSARLQALGPVPPEGETESEELAARRAVLAVESAQAQIPFVEAQEALRAAERLLRDIDRELRARIAAELRVRGPSPLSPRSWAAAIADVQQAFALRRDRATAAWSSPERRQALFQRLPLNLGLILLGLTVAFTFSRACMDWTGQQLQRPLNEKSKAWIVVLRNVGRLILPTVGAGFLFSALTLDAILPAADWRVTLSLPDFVLAVVGAGWLASSLFSPELPDYRLIDLDDRDAKQAARVTLGLGIVLALHLFLQDRIAFWSLAPTGSIAPTFPLFVIGSFLLWRVSRLMRTARRRWKGDDPGAAETDAGGIGNRLTHFLERAILAVAVIAPLIAAAGYFALARALFFPTIVSLGLLGALLIVKDLILKTAQSLTRERVGSQPAPIQEGLLPVAVVAALTLAALPLLALIWGVPRSDLNTVWLLLRDGVTFGGMRISASTVVAFAVVFGIVFGLTRLLQSLLRSAVLPRTRLDAGGRNAILAGVGYTGFFIGILAAISSTGLNLTNVAVVAGALSVGIGFGLQNIVSNFISGIILLVERPIKEGDWIEVGEHAGYVRGISVRSTEIETFDRASVILPNSDLIAGAVLNRTHGGMSGRLSIPVGVSYASDPRHVERVLMAIAEDHPMVLLEPAPRVLFMGFGADSLTFELRCWLRDVNFSLSARSDLNFEIFERFKAEGISIPFPQREIQLKGLREAIREASAEADNS